MEWKGRKWWNIKTRRSPTSSTGAESLNLKAEIDPRCVKLRFRGTSGEDETNVEIMGKSNDREHGDFDDGGYVNGDIK